MEEQQTDEADEQQAQSAEDAEQAEPEDSENGDPEMIEISKDELESLQDERDEWEEKFLRKTADLDNLRKRKREETREIRKFAGEEILEDLLEVVDNFERALESMEIENDDVREGTEMIKKQLYELLEKHGVELMEAEGDRFDPHRHEAMMQEERDDLDEKKVVEVFQQGYLFHDRVLRPATVKVGKPVQAGEEPVQEAQSENPEEESTENTVQS